MNESELRAWVRESAHPFAAGICRAGGGTFYPPRPLAPRYRNAPARPAECFATASIIAERHGLAIVLGFAVPSADPTPRAHVWNVDREGVVDASWDAQGPALAYLGISPTRLELAALTAANAPSIRDLRAGGASLKAL